MTEINPKLAAGHRWGGYFGGKQGKGGEYGANDLMHQDFGGNYGIGMAAGSWEKGLTKQYRGYFDTKKNPSVGMGDVKKYAYGGADGASQTQVAQAEKYQDRLTHKADVKPEQNADAAPEAKSQDRIKFQDKVAAEEPAKPNAKVAELKAINKTVQTPPPVSDKPAPQQPPQVSKPVQQAANQSRPPALNISKPSWIDEHKVPSKAATSRVEASYMPQKAPDSKFNVD
jgi:hypothetical protein